MRFKATAIAIAIAAVAAVGYGIHERGQLGRPQQAAAPTSEPAPPAPFAAADRRGYTPGDDVARYVALGTPTAAFDAWRLIDSCEHAERHALSDAAERCNGITQQDRRKAGELLGTAMMEGVHGAAVAYMQFILGVPREEIAQARRDNPNIDKAVSTAVEKLEEAAPRDRLAIKMLARLYRDAHPVTGARNAEKALVYMTAEHELVPAAGFDTARQRYVASLTVDLTPEQVQRAREAGLRLARNCDCKEG
jgi:hypothetical protein